MGMNSNVGSKNSLIPEIIASVNQKVLSIAAEHQILPTVPICLHFQPEWIGKTRAMAFFFRPPRLRRIGNDKGDFHPRDTCDRDITTHWQVPSRSWTWVCVLCDGLGRLLCLACSLSWARMARDSVQNLNVWPECLLLVGCSFCAAGASTAAWHQAVVTWPPDPFPRNLKAYAPGCRHRLTFAKPTLSRSS